MTDKDDSRCLHVTVHSPHKSSKSTASARQPLLSATFTFDDHIRCMAAKQRYDRKRKSHPNNLICGDNHGAGYVCTFGVQKGGGGPRPFTRCLGRCSLPLRRDIAHSLSSSN